MFHRRFSSDQSGAISIFAALSLMMLVAIAAIAIDAGSLYLARRNLQSTNDAAALAAVQDPDNAASVAAAVFAQNGYSQQTLNVTTGIYNADESQTAAARFTPSGTGVNAVRVQASLQQPAHFAALFGLPSLIPMATRATAARVPSASFGAATRLAQLNGGLINALLSSAFGSSISLSLIDYQSLLDTNISALTFFNQLATDISVSGDYTQLASANVTIGQLLTALVETTNSPGAASGNPTGALQALQALQLQTGGSTLLKLSDVIDLSSLYGRSIGGVATGNGQDEQINLMGILSASTTAAGNGQTMNIGTALTIPVTNSSVAVRIAMGPHMAQISNAAIGTSIHTAQFRLALTITLTNINLGVATASVQIPLYLEGASGQATLTDMPCIVGGTLADITAASGTTSLQLGTVSDAALRDFSTPVTPAAAPAVAISLLGIPIQVNISGTSGAGNSAPQILPFSQADIDAGTVKSVSGGANAPFAQLGSNFALSTTILGNPGVLAGLLNTQLNTLTAALQPIVANLLTQTDSPTNSLLTALGLRLGVTDVSLSSASCRTPTLVG